MIMITIVIVAENDDDNEMDRPHPHMIHAHQQQQQQQQQQAAAAAAAAASRIQDARAMLPRHANDGATLPACALSLLWWQCVRGTVAPQWLRSRRACPRSGFESPSPPLVVRPLTTRLVSLLSSMGGRTARPLSLCLCLSQSHLPPQISCLCSHCGAIRSTRSRQSGQADRSATQV